VFTFGSSSGTFGIAKSDDFRLKTVVIKPYNMVYSLKRGISTLHCVLRYSCFESY
jgi:hypothetical protein